MTNMSKTVKTTTATMNRLRARLQAGAYERCACCLKWFTGKGGVCIHIPASGGSPIPCCLCSLCFGKAESGEAGMTYVTGKVHTYLGGGAA